MTLHAHPLAVGLSTEEATQRLRRWGPNAIPERRSHPALTLVRKLWGPVPWMLEAALALEIALGKAEEALLITAVLVVNALVSFSHERRAREALDLLRAKLHVDARVLRDGGWTRIPSASLVQGDLVHVRMGDLVPADLRLVEGDLLLDRSTLTGESAPVEASEGAPAPAGAIVRRGEATAEVVATGARTTFGRTAMLVGHAGARSHLDALILAMVRAFVGLDVVLAAVVLAVALVRHEPPVEVVPLVLMVLVASVPVALPAMSTLATAVGSAELATKGVLVTHLAALEEIAAVDVLCSDKTGTLTRNELALVAAAPAPGCARAEVIQLAAAASDASTQDPIDVAILEAANAEPALDARRLALVPFDPATKRSEATIARGGATWRVVKGAYSVVSALAGAGGALDPVVDALAARGCRVLAIAAGPGDALRLVGVVGLLDPPRDDAQSVVERLRTLGVRTMMVTGDAAPTARAVAREIGLGERVATSASADPSTLDVLAGVLPEHKLQLVTSLQRAGHVVAMTGDGVNDAPALEQAEVGVAVSTAVDVAKSAAAVVLTQPGLSGLLTAVETGRRIFQRMLTYTLNMSVKKLEIPVFLAIGFLVLDRFVVSPRLVLLLVLTNDLSTMALASDRAPPSPSPRRWNARALVLAAFGIAVPWLVFLVGAVEIARWAAHLSDAEAQTVAFLALAFVGQANVHLVRARAHLWRSPPGRSLVVSSSVTLALVSVLATTGVLMTPIPAPLVLALLAAVAVYTLGLDLAKVRLFAQL